MLGVHYFVYFGTFGIILPYFNLFLSHLGFSGFQIGVVSSVKTICVILFPVGWAILADRLKARKKIFILCAAAGALTWLPLVFADTFYPVLLLIAIHSVFYSPLISFIEAFSMEILEGEKSRYGRFRVWGSLAFIGVSALLGKLLDTTGIAIVMPLILAGLTCQLALSFQLPGSRSGSGPALFSLDDLKQFFTANVLVFLAAAFLMLASHGAYYGFFSIHLEKMGFSTGFIGMAWALASLAEVGVMLGSEKLFAVMGIKQVLVCSFAAAFFRWILLCFSSSAAVILASQLLHALSYGAFHVASILGIESLSHGRARTVGQAVNNSATYGAGMMAGFFFSGLFFDDWGRYLFLASAIAALAGGVLMACLDLEPSSRH